MHQRVDAHCRQIASLFHVLGAATMVSPLCVARVKSLVRACADGRYVLLEVTLRAHCSAAMSFLLVCTHRRCCVVGAVSLLLLRCMICLRYCASSAALDLLVSRSGYTITYYVCAEGWGAACVFIEPSMIQSRIPASTWHNAPPRRHSCCLEGRSQPASSKACSRLRSPPVNIATQQSAAPSPKWTLEFYPGRRPSSPWQRCGSSASQRACPRALCSTAPQKMLLCWQRPSLHRNASRGPRPG